MQKLKKLVITIIVLLSVIILLIRIFSYKSIEKTNFEMYSSLNTITFEELDKKIISGELFIAYFAWPENCGDAKLFNINALPEIIDNESYQDLFYLVNLDILAPESLMDTSIREIIASRFYIDKYEGDQNNKVMSLYSPQLVLYNNGEIVDLVSWTVYNSDSFYGINKDMLDNFFESVDKEILID